MYWNNIQSDTDITFWVANHCWPVWYLRCCPNLAWQQQCLQVSMSHVFTSISGFWGGFLCPDVLLHWSVILPFFFLVMNFKSHNFLFALPKVWCTVHGVSSCIAGLLLGPQFFFFFFFPHPSPHCFFNHPSIKTLYRRPDCGDSGAADASVSQQLSPAYTGDALRQAGQCSPPGVLS